MSPSRSATDNRKALVTPRKSALCPDPGPWSVSYYLIDLEGPFAWPGEQDLMAARLRTFFQQLTRQSFHDVLQATRASGGRANKPVDAAELSAEARARLEVVRPAIAAVEQNAGEMEVCEFTYCLRRSDPRRVWSYLDVVGRCAYPLWWDPEHRVSGYDAKYVGKAAGGLCLTECSHPEEP